MNVSKVSYGKYLVERGVCLFEHLACCPPSLASQILIQVNFFHCWFVNSSCWFINPNVLFVKLIGSLGCKLIGLYTSNAV